ncbi:MAG: MATE family efflux transporter [Anaerovoracaceae bacterium]|nr:MATE family efflux transporter [Anaerovoracaceae bacterium]
MTATLTQQENRLFYRQLLTVGIPVLIQNLIAVGLNLADTIMVGKVSANALAAVGAANQVYFVYSVILFGIFSGAAVYTVQYWGIKDLVSLRKILGIDYVMCLALTVPVVIAAFFASPALMGLFTDDPEVIALGGDYMRIACFSYLFSGMTFVITYNSRAIIMLKVPTVINGGAILINVFLNYCLIYGNCGLPELGVKGAAIATLIARVIECLSMYSYVYLSKDHPLGARFSEFMGFGKELYKSVMRTAVPVMFNEGCWALSVSMVFAAYGKIGPAALAIVQVANTITEFLQTAYAGVSNASTVIVGQALGQGKVEHAVIYSKRIMTMAWILNVVMTLLLIFIREPIAMIYDFDAETTELLLSSMFVFAVAITPKMLTYVIICGILRAGGDTFYCMVVEAGLNLLLQVPLAYISVLVLGLPLPVAIAVVASSDVIKAVLCYRRYYSRKWINIFTGSEVQD